MPRPRKPRHLQRAPRQVIYKPAGMPLYSLARVTLLHEELEALRLADVDGLTQADAAERMGVSRSTFQRVLEAGRRKVALALTDGRALFIQGGTFSLPAPEESRE